MIFFESADERTPVSASERTRHDRCGFFKMVPAVRRFVHCRYTADFEETETLVNRLPNSLRYVLTHVSTIMPLCAALYLKFKNR
jgi:hypothetical protein